LKLLFKLSLITFLSCCYQYLFCQTSGSHKIVSVSVDIVALDKSLDIQYPNANVEEYFIVITLTNTQDTTVHLTTMTCSWIESFIFNTDSFYLYDPGCDSNVPTSLDILPHRTVKFFSVLTRVGKEHDYKNPPSFKIGFVDLPSKFFWESHSQKEKRKYKTYWSDDIYLVSSLYKYKEEKMLERE
jgi:hypothetical protein